MDRIVLVHNNWTSFINRISGYIKDPPHHRITDWNGNRLSGIADFESAFESLGARHGHGAYPPIPKVLLHLQSDANLFPVHSAITRDSVVNPGQMARKLNVHNRPEDLDDFAFVSVQCLWHLGHHALTSFRLAACNLQ
jgi:hypothetical protein